VDVIKASDQTDGQRVERAEEWSFKPTTDCTDVNANNETTPSIPYRVDYCIVYSMTFSNNQRM